MSMIDVAISGRSPTLLERSSHRQAATSDTGSIWPVSDAQQWCISQEVTYGSRRQGNRRERGLDKPWRLLWIRIRIGDDRRRLSSDSNPPTGATPSPLCRECFLP